MLTTVRVPPLLKGGGPPKAVEGFIVKVEKESPSHAPRDSPL